MTHTPGPWEWTQHKWGYSVLLGADGKIIHSDGSAGGEYDADIDVGGPDAALIAAAPDLLEACKAARKALAHDVPDSCWSTGPMTGDPIEDLVVCPGCRAIKEIDAAIAKAEGK